MCCNNLTDCFSWIRHAVWIIVNPICPKYFATQFAQVFWYVLISTMTQIWDKDNIAMYHCAQNWRRSMLVSYILLQLTFFWYTDLQRWIIASSKKILWMYSPCETYKNISIPMKHSTKPGFDKYIKQTKNWADFVTLPLPLTEILMQWIAQNVWHN